MKFHTLDFPVRPSFLQLVGEGILKGLSPVSAVSLGWVKGEGEEKARVTALAGLSVCAPNA